MKATKLPGGGTDIEGDWGNVKDAHELRGYLLASSNSSFNSHFVVEIVDALIVKLEELEKLKSGLPTPGEESDDRFSKV